MLRIHHVLAVFSRFSSRMYYVLSALGTCYGFFKHVQNSVTSLKSFKTIVRSYQFALRFLCVAQAHGAWISFPPPPFLYYPFFQNFNINHSFFKIFIIIPFSSFDNISRRHASSIIRVFCVHSFSTDTV